MDPRKNPYAPGAGTPPVELAGRGDLLERAAIALDRIRERRAARSFIFYGLRGVGKTVLLTKVRQDAEARGFSCVQIEAPEDRSLPALLAPALRAALIKLSAGKAVRARLETASHQRRSRFLDGRVRPEGLDLARHEVPHRELARERHVGARPPQGLRVDGGAASRGVDDSVVQHRQLVQMQCALNRLHHRKRRSRRCRASA